MRAIRLFFLTLAILILALPCVLMPLSNDGLGAENRLPAAWPELIQGNWLNTDFPARYEDWLRDHVALRSLWIGVYSKALRALGASSEDQVILGRENWLFFRETLDDYTGTNLISDDGIARLALLLDTADRALRAKDSCLLLAIVPNKATIYPGKMNVAYPRSGEAGNAARLMARTSVRLVALTDVLKQHSEEGLYFPGDTHWNQRGARCGAAAILSALQEETRVEIPIPDPDADFEIRTDWPSDLMRMLDPYTQKCDEQLYYKEGNVFTYEGRYRSSEDLTIRTLGGAAKLKLLVLRDSFANQLIEDLSNAIDSVTYLRAMPLPLSEAEGTDAVVLEIAERRLPQLLEAPPNLAAPISEEPEDLEEAPFTGIRVEVEYSSAGLRIFGASEEAPSNLSVLRLGVRGADGTRWYDAFPVSGMAEDGDRGFSAQLESFPENAEICLYMRGDTTMRTAWTHCAAPVL